jgi:hypothetical protein
MNNVFIKFKKILGVSPLLIRQNLQQDRATAQALSERPLTAEDWAQSQARPCGVRGLSLSYCHSASVPSSYFHLQTTIYTPSNRQRRIP